MFIPTKSENTIYSVATLTAYGRRLFASGSFDIAYFALSDDGIDYGYVFSVSAGNPPQILSYSLVEPKPFEVPRYHLFSVVGDPNIIVNEIPILLLDQSEIVLRVTSTDNLRRYLLIPSTKFVVALDKILGYSLLFDSKQLNISVAEPSTQAPFPFPTSNPDYKAISGRKFVVEPAQTATPNIETIVLVRGNESGAQAELKVKLIT